MATMMVDERGSTNSNESRSDSVFSLFSKKTERAPLLSQRKLFRSLSGTPNPVEGSSENGRTLGTFAGVFSPVALSMFSALLFLRVGFIVGNAGLWEALLMFCIAYGVLFFTVVSICAISTNGAVEGGGAYFMISRTLGPEFGGSIGTLFFFANIVSSALYITGCSEGLVENFGPSGYISMGMLPDGKWWRFLYNSCLNTVNLLVCLIGARMFARTSVAIFTIVCTCCLSVLISFFVVGPKEVRIPAENHVVQNDTFQANGSYTGLSIDTFMENLQPDHYGVDYTTDGKEVSFAVVFGVLFSGVTGIMAGANMSGELTDPGKSIPKGTLSAVTFTFGVYIILCFLTAFTCTPFLLQNNYIFMMQINIWAPFVIVGIITATFSASLSNLIGASRVLEAVAKDEMFGPVLSPLNWGTWRGNPILAVVMSWILVELFLLIGSLNTIAQLNSVLFMLSYLATNMSCLGLELASAPNFRPNFKYFSWHTALLGFLGTVVMMFIINPIYSSLSMVVCLLLIIGLHMFSPARTTNWGSISQALIFHQVRKYLLLLDSRKDHVKFWRPQMLLMIANPRSSCALIDFVNDLKKGGLYVLGHVKVGNLDDVEVDPTTEEFPYWLTLIDHLKVKAFVELTMANSVREGMHHLVRLSGLGAMKPNTILLGFFDDTPPLDYFGREDSPFRIQHFQQQQEGNPPVYPLRFTAQEKCISKEEYMAMISDILKLQKNACLCRHFHKFDKVSVFRERKNMFLDVWPINFFQPNDDNLFDTTSLFLLQLACIVNMVPKWKGMKMRVFMCVSAQSGEIAKREQYLKQMLQMLRIKASIHVLMWDHVLPLQERRERTYQDHIRHLKDEYIDSCNQMIQLHSQSTAVSFLYLPDPLEGAELSSRYLQLLGSLTKDLPPTLIVHGVSPVTSTTL